jgi:hypothetical protein
LTSPSGKILALATGLSGFSQTINTTFSDVGSINIDADFPSYGVGPYRPYSDLDLTSGGGSVTFISETPTVFSFTGFGLEGPGNYTLTPTFRS